MDLDIKELRARVERLHKLSTGFARERLLWKKSIPPTLYVEQEAYLNAIDEASQAVSKARSVLVKACQRLEEAEKARLKRFEDSTGEK
jgi:hypothetical protein